jgi:diguanylate cyclase (GGDEF)-like protein
MIGTELKPKILVVDDARTNIRVLRHLLKDEAGVLFATSGREALALAGSEQPDLILLDVVMPDMDGYQVCQALKSDPNTAAIPVIFVTGLADTTDETHGLEVGAIDYITKPFVPAVVRMRVRNHLALRRANHELLTMNAELLRLATTDGLTGVYNRRYLLEQITAEVQRMHRYHHPAALFMLDLDHFKRLNDGYGHDIGDRALVETARTVRDALRAHDLFGRLGGEEFAGFLPETPFAEAMQVCERVRELIAAIDLQTPGVPARVTASIGVIALDPETDTVETAIKRADQAMYAAKQGGRNRVVAG